MVALAILLTGLRIAGYGYLPADDALRHAGHAIDNRAWGDILVIRDDIRPDVDTHPGWHSLLRLIHQGAGLDADALVKFSYVCTFTLFGVVGLLASKRPAAWAVALAFTAIVFWEVLGRLLLGRPFGISITALVLILFLWQDSQDRPTWKLVVFTSLILGFAIWMHPTWYLWVMLLPCMWLGRGAKAAMAFLAALALSLLLACAFSGGWYNIITYPLHHLWLSLAQDPLVVTSLAKEFRPGLFPIQAGVLVGFILIVRQLTGINRTDRLLQPDLLLFALGCALGLQVSRFWMDWAAPALTVWICRQIGLYLDNLRVDRSRLLLITACACGIFSLSISANIEGRYSGSRRSVLLTLPDETLLPLMPTGRGILYGNSMGFFYQLYWRFPETKWRYLLGFEPGMMPANELRDFRSAQSRKGNFESVYRSWVTHMTVEDRLILYADGEPVFQGMSFKALGDQIWIGRLKKAQP
jgi:hypothetical protein